MHLQTKYNETNLNSGIASSIMAAIQKPPAGYEDCGDVFIPLDKRIDRYMDELAELPDEDPLGIKEMGNTLQMQPFSFYGAYVQLNNTEKQSFIANNSITYLKLQNLDMLEAIK